MKRWRRVAFVAALALAGGIAVAMAPVALGQSKSVTVQRSPRVAVAAVPTGGSRLGVSVRDIEEADTKSRKDLTGGVLVEDVSDQSPAEKAGIRTGDVIVEFDGERVRSARQLTRLVQETPAGRSVPVIVLRDGQRTNLTVTPEAGGRFSFGHFEFDRFAEDLRLNVPRPPNPPTPPSVWRFDGLLGRTSRLGVTVGSLSSQLAEYFGVKGGVLVSSVTSDSAASRAGLKAGDVITSLNGSTVDDPSDVRRRIDDLQAGDEFTIEVTRERKPLTLKGRIEDSASRRSSRSMI